MDGTDDGVATDSPNQSSETKIRSVAAVREVRGMGAGEPGRTAKHEVVEDFEANPDHFHFFFLRVYFFSGAL